MEAAARTMAKRFDKFDKDMSGALDAEETKHMLRRLGYPPDDFIFNETFTRFDTDGNGTCVYKRQ